MNARRIDLARAAATTAATRPHRTFSRRHLLGLAAAWTAPTLAAVAASTSDGGFATVLAYGADPQGLKDSTAALNAALANTMLNGKPSNAGRELRIPKGVYIVSGTLKVGSGQRLVFEPGVRIDATRLTTEDTHLFAAAGQTDIVMTGNGAELIGSGATARKGVEGGQTGILIYGCSNVVVRDFKIRGFATDGLYVGGESSGDNPARNVRIENCEVRDCRRNALSIVSCDGCVVVGGVYASSSGAPHGPWAGIDVEPNRNQQATGVKLVNVRTQDNAGPGLLFVPGESSLRQGSRFDVEVVGGESHNDGSLGGYPALRFACGGPMLNPVGGQVAVRRFQVFSPKSSGVAFTNWDADKAPLALLEDVAVIDPDGTANAHSSETRTGFVIYCDKGQVVQALGNIRLVRCRAEDRRAVPRMVRGGILLADPGKSIRKVAVLDFGSKNALSRLKYDFSTLASEVPGGLVDTTVEYTNQEPAEMDVGAALHEMGGRGVRATRAGLRFSLPPAANCRGMTMIVSAAPAIQGTTIAAEGADRIQPAKGTAYPELTVAAGRLVTLKSDGGSTWTEQ